MTTPAMTPSGETTRDAFLGGALMLRQPKHGYRAGIDPVLLAATCHASSGARVLDCGAGVGTVGLCVARRLPEVHVTLVERETAYAALARSNIDDNALGRRVTVIEADLTAPISRSPELASQLVTFDHALANPPYAIDSNGTRSADRLKDAANAMPSGELDDWVRCMAAMLVAGGTATFIHRADALPLLFAALDRRFGGLIVCPIHPRADEVANRVLVRGVKGSRAPLQLRPPLIMHDATGAYTPRVDAVLRGQAALVDVLH